MRLGTWNVAWFHELFAPDGTLTIQPGAQLQLIQQPGDFTSGQTFTFLTADDGIVGIPDITVRADSEDILNLSLMELTPRMRVPDPRGETNRKVLRATREGRIHTYGALTNLPLALRLTRVMSVA